MKKKITNYFFALCVIICKLWVFGVIRIVLSTTNQYHSINNQSIINLGLFRPRGLLKWDIPVKDVVKDVIDE